jgi:hypothetical protein
LPCEFLVLTGSLYTIVENRTKINTLENAKGVIRYPAKKMQGEKRRGALPKAKNVKIQLQEVLGNIGCQGISSRSGGKAEAPQPRTSSIGKKKSVVRT